MKKAAQLILMAAIGVSLTTCNSGSGNDSGISHGSSVVQQSANGSQNVIKASNSTTDDENVNQYPAYNVRGEHVSPQQAILMEARWLLDTVSVGRVIPKSYDDTMQYWDYLKKHNTKYQEYRKTNDAGNCQDVKDSNSATIERAMMNNGLDVYDGAVWEIALSLVANTNQQAYDSINKFNHFLATDNIDGGFQSYKAYSTENPSNWMYNGHQLASKGQAYFMKFISPSWGKNYDAINGCDMNWPSYEGVTGEQAWLAFIAPVQTVYNLYDGKTNLNWANNPDSRAFLQLGENSLDAIIAMQAPNGGVYRNVMVNNTPQLDQKSISLENNWSLYAGLTMLRKGLEAQEGSAEKSMLKQSSYSSNPEQAKRLMATIDQDKTSLEKIKQIQDKMVQFFTADGVYNATDGYYYTQFDETQGGFVHKASEFAVDVQTWGAVTIVTNPELLQAVTAKFGEDAPYNMLKAAIAKSGYRDQNGKLLGVGYTAQTPTDSHYEMSGEWTLGAIDAAIVLASYYKDDTAKHAQLMEWAKDMLAGVRSQVTSQSGVNPNSYATTLSVLYANKRVMIPFGWWSNKVPSTASTAWDLMMNSCYDPLQLGGGDYKDICQQLGLDISRFATQ